LSRLGPSLENFGEKEINMPKTERMPAMSDDDIREHLLNTGQWLEAWISQRVIDDTRKMIRAPKKK
jgi:hypothetical protein